MKPRKEQTLCCAIYTIKSSEEGLPLIGKLFDEAGEALTPSHAVKGNRRYRYYVSCSLLKGTVRTPSMSLSPVNFIGVKHP